MSAQRVLVVDDHQLLRQGLSVLLEKEHFDVVGEAGDGAEALLLARSLRPDLVLMDLTMPELNGIDATRQILAEMPHVKVIAVSARTDGSVVSDALAAGAVAFIPKASAFDELAIALEAVARGETYMSPKVAGGLVNTLVQRNDDGGGLSTGRSLTSRERQVLQLLAEGMAMKQIAHHLNLSVKTIETHRRQIMDKLDLHSVAELTKYAVRHGMTPE